MLLHDSAFEWRVHAVNCRSGVFRIIFNGHGLKLYGWTVLIYIVGASFARLISLCPPPSPQAGVVLFALPR